VRVSGCGRHEERLWGTELTIDQGHGDLGVEVGAIAQPLDDGVGSPLRTELGEQAGDDGDLHAGHIRKGRSGQCHPLLDAEQACAVLRSVVGDPEDDVIEQGGGATDDVNVPEGDRVEGSGVYGERHAARLADRLRRAGTRAAAGA